MTQTKRTAKTAKKMIQLSLRIALISMVMCFASCKSSSSENSEDPIGDNLSITPDNIKKVYDEFELDTATANKKYELQDIFVYVTLNPDDPYLYEIRKPLTFEYSTNEKYLNMPFIETEPNLRVVADVKLFSDNPDSLQGYIQMTKGFDSWYGLPKEDFLNYYFIYDKKKDCILTMEHAQLVATWISLYNSKNTTAAMFEDLEMYKFSESREILDAIKNGDLYYYEEKSNSSTKVDMGGYGDLIMPESPAQSKAKSAGEPYLLPCMHLFKGKVARPIKLKESRIGNFYDFKILSTEYVKTVWNIDKKIFNKQVVYGKPAHLLSNQNASVDTVNTTQDSIQN